MKIKSGIISSNDGTSIWQPGVKGNCVTMKVSPWNIVKTQHTVFIHEMPKGGEVPEHAHESNEEIFICLAGEAVLTIDGDESIFKQHDIAFIAPHSKHYIRAISDTPFKVVIIISPTGLEDRLKLMGKIKNSTDELPPDTFDSDIGKQNTHGVV